MLSSAPHEEVKTVDMVRVSIALPLAEKTIGAVMTVDGGNIAAAMR